MNPQIFQQSHSQVFSSVNGVPIVDKEIKKTMDNIKLHILERDKNIIKEYEYPVLNIRNKNNLFNNQKNMTKNLVLEKAMRNFQNIRDSISIAKEKIKKEKAITKAAKVSKKKKSAKKKANKKKKSVKKSAKKKANKKKKSVKKSAKKKANKKKKSVKKKEKKKGK